jgi:dihydrofolate synthase/folylpolyglutamate synthase
MSAEPKPKNVEQWLLQLGSPSADRDYRPGHERMHALMAYLPLRRPGLRIRIAGTNGKGSTAFFLSAALRAAGYRVGLYTSPHILDFNERIRIDGSPVDDECLGHLLEKLLPEALNIGASYFEVATALALGIFAQEDCAVEILEAGVGARLDATTAVPADMALITPIGLDHQAWLGDTLSQIAREKAWVMDGCIAAVSAPQPPEVENALLSRCSDLSFVTTFDDAPGLKAIGEYQRMNAALAIAALKLLLERRLIAADFRRMKQAISETVIPGRLQHVSCQGNDFWLDAAHNVHALGSLLPSLPGLADPLDGIFVFTRADRNMGKAVSALRPFARKLIGGPGYEHLCDLVYETVDAALTAEVAASASRAYLVMGSFESVRDASIWLGAGKQSPGHE